MPLFKCQKCGVIENTALSPYSWTSKEKLCSECDLRIGKWHGKFEKSREMPVGEEDYFNPL